MGGSASKSPKSAEIVSKHYDVTFQSLPSMQGKNVVITGSTTGTGFIAARAVAQKGGNVLLLNRPSERATSAAAKIQAVAAPGAKIKAIDCDLADFSSVKKAAAKVKREFPQGLNVLCNNAGVMALSDQATKDGYDVQMQTNHLSHFLLTKELWPLLEKAADARVINHSRHGVLPIPAIPFKDSGTQGPCIARNAPNKPMNAKNLGKNGGNLGGDPGKGGFRDIMMFSPAWERYQQTKLANALFTFALDRKLKSKGSSIKALLAHPGVAATELQVTTAATQGYPAWWSSFIVKTLGHSAEDGTLPLMKCIFEPDAPSGTFYGTKGFGAGPPTVQKPKASENMFSVDQQALLWSESEKAVGGEFTL